MVLRQLDLLKTTARWINHRQKRRSDPRTGITTSISASKLRPNTKTVLIISYAATASASPFDQLSKQAPSTDKLPPDLLIRIFELVVVPKTWSIQQLRRLALVSKLWLSIVKSTPSLWAVAKYDSHLSTQYDTSHVTTALSKSKKAPLTATRHVQDHTDDIPLRWFLENVTQHAHRFHSLSLTNLFARDLEWHTEEYTLPFLHALIYQEPTPTRPP